MAKFLLFLFFVLSLVFAPIFHYHPTHLIFYLFPLISFIFLIICKNKLILALGLFFVLAADLLVSGILSPSLHLQIDKTVFADNHIKEAILGHQQDALYLPYRARPILFNGVAYLYSAVTHAFYFLAFDNLYKLFLLSNLYLLILGLLSLINRKASAKKYFVLASIGLTVVLVGFSRSVEQEALLFVIWPLIFYILALGFIKANTKLYLALLLLTLFLQKLIS